MVNYIDKKLFDSKNKKVISFSVYGEKEVYQFGAEKNVEIAKKIYPDWVCRFYCSKEISNIEKLKSLDCEVLVVDTKIPEMFWRFFTADDPSVSAFISRDTDSVVNSREKAAVDDWLISTSQFHTMHDHSEGHWSDVMGGMWGLKLPINFSMIKRIDDHVKLKKYKFNYNDDQAFLCEKILPLFKSSWLDHHNKPQSSKFDSSVKFPNHPKLDYGGFVGDRVSLFQMKRDTFQDNPSKKVYLISHLGPTDHFNIKNAIQYLINSYDQVIIPIKKHSENSVNYMFGGNKNVTIKTVDDDDAAFKLYTSTYEKTHKLISLGYHGENFEGVDWSEKLCFLQLNVPLNNKLFNLNSKQGIEYKNLPKELLEIKEVKKESSVSKIVSSYKDKILNILTSKPEAYHENSNLPPPPPRPEEPLVSAVVSTYNRFNFVFNTINSIKNQTYKNIEIILVNDNSSDERYRKFDWSKVGVKIIHLDKNSKEVFGYACSGGYQRNFGMEVSKGEYIAFCDDDDVWLPHKIESQIKAIHNTEYKICSTEALFGSGVFDKNKQYKLYNQEVYIQALTSIFKNSKYDLSNSKKIPTIWDEGFWNIHNVAICSSVMIHKNIYKQHGKFAPMQNSDDYEYWKRIIKGRKALYLNEPHVYYDSAHGDGIAYSWGK